MSFLTSILLLYLVLSAFSCFLHLTLHWEMYKAIACSDTDFENGKRRLELDHGFITPREHYFKLESYKEGIRNSIIIHLIRSPFTLPFLLYALFSVLFAGLVYGVGPDEVIPADEVVSEIEERNRAKLARYEEKMKKWREQENRRASDTKFVWSAPAPVLR